MQRVEQEVRLKLMSQRPHLCLPRHRLKGLQPATLFFKRVIVLDAEIEEAPRRQDKATAYGIRKDIGPMEVLRARPTEAQLRPHRRRGDHKAQSVSDTRAGQQGSNQGKTRPT